MADDASSLMTTFDITPERTVVVGHSMGGMVACQLASVYSFAGAVLIGPVHPSSGVANVFSKRIETVEKRKFGVRNISMQKLTTDLVNI